MRTNYGDSPGAMRFTQRTGLRRRVLSRLPPAGIVPSVRRSRGLRVRLVRLSVELGTSSTFVIIISNRILVIIIVVLCSARPTAELEFRPGGCFAARRIRTTLSPKWMTTSAIQPRDTRTRPNATCRPISARESGSLDLGARYLTSLEYCCFCFLGQSRCNLHLFRRFRPDYLFLFYF